MKRILSLLAIATVSLTWASRAHAQFGFLAGLTSSKANTTEAVDEAKNITLYHAGVTYKIDLGSGFAIQPSIIYQVKGANLGKLDQASDKDFKVKSGFVEVPVGFQWGPDLLAFRPYLLAEPFVGYRVTFDARNTGDLDDWFKQAKNKLEYGFGLGGGLEISKHIQLSVQWFKNLGVMFGEDAIVPESVDWGDDIKNVKNYEGIKFSLAILF